MRTGVPTSLCLTLVVFGGLMTFSGGREFVPSQETNHIYEQIRKVTMSVTKETGPIKRKGVNFQEPIPEGLPFPCDTRPGAPGARSSIRPTSVHQLRPGDIDVIGALGDSLMSANGAASFNILQAYVENRGLSFAIGGDATWRKHLTLANILKEFNPNLVGYSLGDSLGFMNGSMFNVAEPIAMNRDVIFQAELLTRRIKADKRIDFEKDWKLVTILMGHNDFCSDMCYRNSKALPDNTRVDLEKALDYFHDNLPRTIINLLPPINVMVVKTITQPPVICKMFYRIACSCFFGQRSKQEYEMFENIVKQCQQLYFQIVDNKKYSDKEDFAVVLQPLLINATYPQKSVNNRNVTDYSALAKDCFHFSQKGHAIVANSLWNNMLEPVGNKSYTLTPGIMEHFSCPTVEHPYIFTAENSVQGGTDTTTIAADISNTEQTNVDNNTSNNLGEKNTIATHNNIEQENIDNNTSNNLGEKNTIATHNNIQQENIDNNTSNNLGEKNTIATHNNIQQENIDNNGFEIFGARKSVRVRNNYEQTNVSTTTSSVYGAKINSKKI